MKNHIKLVWHTERKLVSDLKNWSKNPRKISSGSFERLLDKIKSRGFHDVIKIDTDNVVLSGNQRKKALAKLNIREVNVLIPNRKLTKDEKNKIALESNISDGEWDYEGLKSFNLDTLSDVGLDTEEISGIWNENLEAESDDFNIEDALKKIHKPKTKKGDLIILGEHKLLCSDSTDPDAVKALFGNEKASVIYSDPPYNINLDYNKGVGNKGNYGGKVDDNKSAEDYKKFIRKTLVNALSVSKKDVHSFYWCDEAWVYIFQTLYNELGIKNRRLNVWIKNNSSPTPTVAFNKTAEFCVYGTRGSPPLSSSLKNLNEVMNKGLTNGNDLHEGINNLWMVRRLGSSSYEHPTSKPPELHEKAMKRCSKAGDIVFDSFSGSASSIICAEQLKRRVYSIETSEIFCDLAIRRWEKLTGKKAKIIKNYYEKE